MLPDTRADQWEHTYFYRNSDVDCDNMADAREGRWTASPIYVINENTPDPLNGIELEDIPRLNLGSLVYWDSGGVRKKRPVGIWKKIKADNDLYYDSN